MAKQKPAKKTAVKHAPAPAPKAPTARDTLLNLAAAVVSAKLTERIAHAVRSASPEVVTAAGIVNGMAQDVIETRIIAKLRERGEFVDEDGDGIDDRSQ